MRPYFREIAKVRLSALFEESEAETVLTWLEANDGRKPVVVIGAGFSLNAKNRRSGMNATRVEAPLWSDITDRFETDLGLKNGHHDALTLAELHREALQPAAHCSVLLDLFKDDELVPGEAHSALFDYPAEAIVTTNALDTLLDKNDRGWARIVEDRDLGLRKRGSAPDLIYFHGHRCSRSSWVFTRSQYEDIVKNRPLIVTRVRQLLSQNPVLIVGFGLGDPDFHQIYRQLSLDMQNHHPLGLALFPYGHGPRSFERTHWGKLGIRVAEFRSRDPVGAAFRDFFKLNPTFEASIEDATTIADRIRELASFADRRALAQDFLSEDRRLQEHPSVDLDKQRQVWEAVISAEFSEEEWQDIGRIYLEDLRYDETVDDARIAESSGKSKFRGFLVLPRDRFSTQERFLRRVDAFLARRPEARVELARWMILGFRHGIEGSKDPDFLNCLSWLWTQIATSAVDALRDEASEAIRSLASFAIAGRTTDEKQIRADAETAGVDVSDVGPAEDYNPGYVGAMATGLAALLNSQFAGAREAYEHAASLARTERNNLCEWFALVGSSNARVAELAEENEWAPSDATLDTVRERLRVLREAPAVQRWRGRAESYRDGVRKMSFSRLLTERRHQLLGGRTTSWSKTPAELLELIRELEAIHAPPGLLREWLEPLVELEFFDLEKEFAYRLRLAISGAEKTTHWLARTLSNPEPTLAAATERDRKLLAEFRRSDVSISELGQRVQVFPSLAQILWVEDLDWAAQFADRAKEQLGPFKTTWHSTHSYRDDFANCWVRYAELDTRSDVLDGMEAYAKTLDGLGEREAFLQRCARLPLGEWVYLFSDHQSGERLVRLVLDIADAATSDEAVASRTRVPVGWALYDLFHGLKRHSAGISEELEARACAWAEDVLAHSPETDGRLDYEAYGTAFHVKWLTAQDDDSRSSVLVQGLNLVEELARGEVPLLGSAAGLLERILEADVGSDADGVQAAASALQSRIHSDWEEVVRVTGRSIHYGRPIARFYARLLSWRAANTPEQVRNELLRMLSQHADLAAECDVVMDPEHWGDQWQRFVDCLREVSYAQHEAQRVDSVVGITRLVEGWVQNAPAGQQWRRELQFLPESLFGWAWDRSSLIANRSAYAILRCAANTDADSDVVRFRASLSDMAKDPRLAVRGAAAYSVGLLPRKQAHPELVDLANEMRSSLADEPYAFIQRQLRLGEVER